MIVKIDLSARKKFNKVSVNNDSNKINVPKGECKEHWTVPYIQGI